MYILAMKSKIKFKLEEQLLQLQAQNNQRYSYRQISETTGLKRQTVERIARNESYQDLLGILAVLLDFFAAEGMPITIDDLFTVEDVNPPSAAPS